MSGVSLRRPFLMVGHGGVPIGQGLTRFLTWGGQVYTATESEIFIAVTQDFTLNVMFFQLDQALGAGESVTVTVRNNGVDTLMTLARTDADNAVIVKPLFVNVTFTANNLFSLRVVTSALSGTVTPTIMIGGRI